MSVKIIARSKGRSAVAAAAYRHAARLRDERTGTTHDYRRKSGVLHSEILAPEGVQVSHRARLWNLVERCERRRDAQLAREIEVALPAELTLEQQLALTRAWVRVQLVERGMIADIAIHGAGRGGDSRNVHAHIMATLRRASPTGFGQKDRTWGNRDMLREWRATWAEFCNRHLELAGSDARVDHRTLRAQGIDRQPGIKKGRAAAIDRKAKHVVSDRGKVELQIRAKNRLARLARYLAIQGGRAVAEELVQIVVLDEEQVSERERSVWYHTV